jgi:uncharacterized membrane protein (DUF4010 family)
MEVIGQHSAYFARVGLLVGLFSAPLASALARPVDRFGATFWTGIIVLTVLGNLPDRRLLLPGSSHSLLKAFRPFQTMQLLDVAQLVAGLTVGWLIATLGPESSLTSLLLCLSFLIGVLALRFLLSRRKTIDSSAGPPD